MLKIEFTLEEREKIRNERDILDNTRHQQCQIVKELAELLYLPPYSLHLFDRTVIAFCEGEMLVLRGF